MSQALNMLGYTIGRLKVTGGPRSATTFTNSRVRTRAYWNCLCECGNTVEVEAGNLRNGHSQSCGCLRRELTKERFTIHGLTESAEFRIWTGILSRCQNPNVKAFPLYGGAGVSVCERWLTFGNFLADMGRRPSLIHSVDRINTLGNYEPSNCRWATRKQQANNRRDNIRLTFAGQTRTVREWSDTTGMDYFVLIQRHSAGWPVGAILTRPVRSHP